MLGLLDLNDEVLACILCSRTFNGENTARASLYLELTDLLHVTRVCARLRQVVHKYCDEAWRLLYTQAFPPPVPAPPVDTYAMLMFKERYKERSKALKLERKLKLMKLKSEVQVLKQDIKTAQDRLAQERSRRRNLNVETKTLEQEMRVREVQARSAWVPTAVRHSWDMVVSNSTAVEPSVRLKQIEEERKTSESATAVLQRQIQACKKRLKTCTQKLKAIEEG